MFTEDLLKRFPILNFFRFDHLRDLGLQERSRLFAELAQKCVEDPSGHPAEVAAGLRKLLEAKDCLVRAMLPSNGLPVGSKAAPGV